MITVGRPNNLVVEEDNQHQSDEGVITANLREKLRSKVLQMEAVSSTEL